MKNKKGNGDGKMDQTYMKEKPVVPLLLSMGIPVIISMIAGALYNIVDSIFVAMISEDAMTAVSDPEPCARSRGWVWRWYQCDGGETPWRRKNTDGEPDSIAGSIFKCLTWNDFNDFRNGGDSVFPADVYER